MPALRAKVVAVAAAAEAEAAAAEAVTAGPGNAGAAAAAVEAAKAAEEAAAEAAGAGAALLTRETRVGAAAWVGAALAEAGAAAAGAGEAKVGAWGAGAEASAGRLRPEASRGPSEPKWETVSGGKVGGGGGYSGGEIDAVVLMCGVNDFKYVLMGRTSSAFHRQLRGVVEEIRAVTGDKCWVILPANPMVGRCWLKPMLIAPGFSA